MVYRTVAYIVFVHQIHDVGNGLWIVSGIAIYFHIENMAATREFVIRSLDNGFVSRRTVVIDRHMVGISIVFTIGDAGELSE